MSRYKPYPKYKESGVEWLGEVPEHWDVVPMKYIALLNPKKSEVNTKKNIDVQFVPMEKLKTDRIDLDETKTIEEVYEGYNYFKNSDILLAKVTPCYENRNIAIARNLKNGIGFGSSEIYTIRVNEKNLTEYYYYFLQEDTVIKLGTAQMTGAGGLKRVPSDFITNLYAPHPPKDEQKQIADYLDTQTAKIDTLIGKQERLIELLQEKRQALISQAVTKGLDPNVKMKDSGVEWLGEVPEHWDITKMKYIIKRIESGTSVNAANTPALNEEIGVLKTSCVYTGRFDHSQNKTVYKSETSRVSCPLKENTLIVSRMNTPDLVGAAGFVEYAPNNIYLPDRLWQVIFGFVCPAFIHYLTLTDIYRGYIQTVCEGTSSSMQNLSQDDFRNFIFALPDKREQQQIADYLDIQTAKIDTLIEKAKQAIKLLKERRTALISAAVTGKIDVRGEAI